MCQQFPCVIFLCRVSNNFIMQPKISCLVCNSRPVIRDWISIMKFLVPMTCTRILLQVQKNVETLKLNLWFTSFLSIHFTVPFPPHAHTRARFLLMLLGQLIYSGYSLQTFANAFWMHPIWRLSKQKIRCSAQIDGWKRAGGGRIWDVTKHWCI